MMVFCCHFLLSLMTFYYYIPVFGWIPMALKFHRCSSILTRCSFLDWLSRFKELLVSMCVLFLSFERLLCCQASWKSFGWILRFWASVFLSFRLLCTFRQFISYFGCFADLKVFMDDQYILLCLSMSLLVILAKIP